MKSMARNRLSAALVLAALIVAPLTGCKKNKPAGGEDKAKSGAPTSFPRNETLYLGGRQWGEPSTFNPLIQFTPASMANMMAISNFLRLAVCICLTAIISLSITGVKTVKPLFLRYSM
jgi:hypothetical protein